MSNEDVPYGIASSYLYGHYKLAEGEIEEALRHLHFAYRTHPDVPEIAWDFQEALVVGQYYKDALEILNQLVEEYPDEDIYYLQRSHVFLQMGQDKKALADMRELRKRGIVNLDVVVGEATILAGMGKADQALDVCRDGLKVLPEHGPRLYLTMAVILDQEGRQSELPEMLEEAVRQYPDSPQLHDILIRSYMTVGKEKKALQAAQAADRHFLALYTTGPDPEASQQEDLDSPSVTETPPSFVVELADMYTQQGSPERAIEILEPIFEAKELGREPSLWLARLHLGTNDTDRGLELVEIILQRWPNTGQAWFIRGRALEADGKIEEALEDYAKGVKYAPEDVQVRLGYIRGMLLAWERDYQAKDKTPEQQEKVRKIKKQANETMPLVADGDAEGNLILGYAFRSADELENAVASFGKAALFSELTIPATLQMSVCYDNLGDEANARIALEALREQFPDDPEVANSLGYYLAEKGLDLELAHSLIKQALKSDPGTGAYLDSMGWVLFQQGKSDDAFDYMIQAVNVLPDDPVILEHLGLVLMDLGQKREGEEMLRRALALGGDKERLEKHLNQNADQGGQE